jgi:SAM-dependent methyltransferase
MEWKEEEKCVWCGSEKIAYNGYGMVPILHFPEVLMNVPLGVITTYSICTDCGMVFQNPHMDNDALAEFYRSGMYRQVINDPNNRMEEDEKNGQIQWAKLVPDNVKHLDIGCSHGHMLELTKERGCEVMGVEPNRNYVNGGVPSVATLYEVKGQWDVITCKHVLEHVPDLPKFVDKMIGLLKPGGTLYLEVPKDGVNGSSPRLQHLYMFTREMIEKMFDKLIIEKYEANPHHFFVMRKEE